MAIRYPGEGSSTLEFKESLPKHAQLMKTVVGFCNRKGGRIIVGVRDDRTVVGLPEPLLTQALETLDEAIYSSSLPHIVPHIYVQRIDDLSVLILEVSSGMNKPYRVKSENPEKAVYVRLGRSTLVASPEMIQELQWESRGRALDSLPVYDAKEEDLEWEEIRRFFKLPKDAPLDKAFLIGHRLLIQEHAVAYPTTASILTFGKNAQQFFSESIIVSCHFMGTSGREALATIDCTGPLLRQFREAFHFVTSRIPRSFTIKGPIRKEISEVPEEAIREAILNMIVHRNYHIAAPSKIFIYDDRIEFFSPGDIPGPFNVHNLRSGLTYIRNPTICSFFRRAGLIEKLGTGFVTMLETMERSGLQAPKLIEGENFVKCILPRIRLEESEVKSDTTKILEYLGEVKEASISEFMKILHLSRTSCYRRLEKLVKEGVLRRTGTRKDSRYLLSSTLHIF